MTRLKNFTLADEALNITAYLKEDGSTAYTIELHPEFDKDGLTWDNLCRFRKGIRADAKWDGVIEDGTLDDFEDSWAREEADDC